MSSYSCKEVLLFHKHSIFNTPTPPYPQHTHSLSYQFLSAMKDGCSGADLARKCLSFQFSPEATATVQKCWQLKAGQMAMSILSRTITANQLVDMDWSFGVTASSDDCDNIGKTYLILKLTIDGEGGLKDVFLELSLDQFYQFLAQMENCKSYLDFMDSA